MTEDPLRRAIGSETHSTRTRISGVGGTLSFHLLLLLAFWFFGTSSRPLPVDERKLITFDVIPEPPPPAPPPLPTPKTPPEPRASKPSGSPRPSRAPLARASNLQLPKIQDVTIAFDAPPLPSPGTSDAPAVGVLGNLPASGTGTGGSGIGNGNGTGRGQGRSAMKGATWLHYPTPGETRKYWPALALQSHMSGRALLSCIVPRPGPPKRCRLQSETPEGAGFGAAALQMSTTFRIRPVTRDSRTVDMEIMIPVVFDYKELPKR